MIDGVLVGPNDGEIINNKTESYDGAAVACSMMVRAVVACRHAYRGEHKDTVGSVPLLAVIHNGSCGRHNKEHL